MEIKTKTFSYTITESEFNELPDQMKTLFKESNIDPSDIIPNPIKEWKKGKLEQIERAKENEKNPV